MRVVHGLLIRGLSWNNSADPTLFVDGPLDAATIPGGYGPLSDASLQVVNRLVPGSVSGAVFNNTLRDPLGQGSTPTCRLIDDGQAPTFTALFAADPAYRVTKRWAAYDVVRVLGGGAPDTQLRLRGYQPPEDDSILYLDGEAIKPVLNTQESPNTWLFDISRGQCGSRVLTHYLMPSNIPPGDNGSRSSLTLASRPLRWEAFEAILVRFSMLEEAPNSVKAVDWVWSGTLAGAPTYDAKTRHWTVGVAHDVKRINDFIVPGAKDVETERCVIVRHVGSSPQFTPRPGMAPANLRWPDKIEVRLAFAELQRLWNVAVGKAQSVVFDAALVSELDDNLKLSDFVEWELFGEVGGHKWVWQVDDLVFGSERLVSLFGSLLSTSDGADISDAPIEYPASGRFSARAAGANQGFILYEAPHAFLGDSDVVRRDMGEAPPKLTIRARINATWPEATLIRLTSGHGGQRNGDYDLLVGGRGLQLDPSSLSIGSTPVDPLAVDEGTTALLELASQEEEQPFAVLPKERMGDWLRNELLVNCCSWGYLPSTGQMAARRLARRPGSRAALRTMVGAENLISSKERITSLKVLQLGRGINPVTLEIEVQKALQLFDGQAKDYENAPTLRLWNEGGLFTEDELSSGPLGRLFRWLFGSSMGSPHVWDVKIPIEQAVVFGDQMLLTDPTLPTASGFGVTNLGVVVISPPDLRAEDGKQIVRVIEDVYNNEAAESGESSASEGFIPPRLRIEGIVLNPSAGRYVLHVVSVDAHNGFNIKAAAFSAYQEMAANGARLKVIYAGAHNPVAVNERRGALEASGVVNSNYYSGGRNYLDLTVDAAFARGGFTLTDIVRRGAYVVFQDLVPATQTPAGTVLQGDAAQDIASADGLRFTHPRRPSLNNRRSLVGA